MSSIARPRQRRRTILSCVECRKRKQKCDRGHPCMQCVARGTEKICTYERFKSLNASVGNSPLSNDSSSSDAAFRHQDSESSGLLRHAHNYGYSNSESLNSMEMLTKVIAGIDPEISLSQPAISSYMHGKVRSEYYGFVRRLPSNLHCELLFHNFFPGVNNLNTALDETIFQEQSERWWNLAYDVLLKQGPEKLPEDLRFFPALIFQVLAVALQFLPVSYDVRLNELKFGPSQTFAELSREYTECGVAISELLGRLKPTLVGVQHSFMRDWWLVNTGDLMQAWNHSGKTVKDAMAIGLHLEPEVPSSSQPEALLDTLWMNELRKRTWLNVFVWDSAMALGFGRPMFIDLKECTVSAPMDCDIPVDRLRRVPVARSDLDKPTPMTERLLRLKLSLRFPEIRELEADGPIPRDPTKVKELHDFATSFRKSLPPAFQTSNPDTTWDSECQFLRTHRELLSYTVDSFLMALHRPYIFTREKSQRQVYESSLAILDSQDRLFEATSASEVQFYIGLTFPTFDAAVLLAVPLVSSPEQYQASFSRPYSSLKNALERLAYIGSTLALAKTGAEILETILHRVMEAQERSSFNVSNISDNTDSPLVKSLNVLRQSSGASKSASASVTSDSESWRFEVNQSTMDWTGQSLDCPEFDFSTLEVPMPLKELFLEEEMSGLPDADPWAPLQEQLGLLNEAAGLSSAIDLGENRLWNFLVGYPTADEN